MANLTIRNLNDGVVEALKRQAKVHNHSLEAEARQILTNHVRRLGRGSERVARADRIAAMTPDVPQTDSTQMIRDDRDLRYTVNEISRNLRMIAQVEFPDRPAVYGVFVNDPKCLPTPPSQANGFLYLGKSMSPKDRGHFNTGKTSSSTLRRTLGALLKQELGLHAYARGRALKPIDFTNYRFDEDGEEKLTEWMNANLKIGFSVVCDDVRKVEKRLIPYCEPPLNLTDWQNPNSELIKTLRKICADEARRNGPLPKR